MAEQRSRLKLIEDWVSYKIFQAVLGYVGRKPYDARVAWFGRFSAKFLGPIAGYKRRILKNLDLIHPEMSAADKYAFADRMLDNFGRTLCENFFGKDFGKFLRDQGTVLEGEGLAALAQAKAEGRPVLMVAGHFGNHEAPRHLLTDLGYTIGGIYRPMSNRYFDAHYEQTLEILGGQVFRQGREGTFAFHRYLLNGGIGILFIDVHDPDGEKLPFLGVECDTPVSAARLAKRCNAVVIPFFGIRKPDGLGFRCVLEAPVPIDEPIPMTKAITARLEARVRENPDQWFWVHRRWKS